MIRRFCSTVWLLISLIVIFSATAVVASAQSQPAASPKDAAQEQQKEKTAAATPHSQPADVAGDWQISWEVRMGTDRGTLHLQQNGTKLTGTFKDVHGISSLSGTVENNQISFEVQFQGKYPFTTRFTGKASSDKIEGNSEATDVTGDGGAFLGHGGEVQHPEHPWTATRAAGDSAHSTETSSAATAPVKTPAKTPAKK